MSELGIAVVAAFAGGLATYLLDLSAQSKVNFVARKIAIKAVQDEFTAAQILVAAADKEGGLWAPPRSLPGNAWESYGQQLAGILDEEDLDDVKKVRDLLVAVDRAVKRVQDAAGDKERARTLEVPEKLARKIEGLKGQLSDAIAILDGATEGAKAESSRIQRTSIGAVVAIGAIVLVGTLLPTAKGIVDAPAVTDDSVATQLRAEMPNSNLAICDESKVFEGAYRCAVDFGGCNGQLEATTNEPSCPPRRQRIYKVLADEDCFEATEMEMIEDGVPTSDPPGKPTTEDFRAGCLDD